jgi:Tfp pilus assembly protein PilF
MMSEFRYALENYNKALELNPDSAECHYNIASAYLDTGDTNKALHHFKKSLEHDPNNPEIHLNIANILEQMGEKTKAYDSFKHALNLNDNSAKALEGIKRLADYEEEEKER